MVGIELLAQLKLKQCKLRSMYMYCYIHMHCVDMYSKVILFRVAKEDFFAVARELVDLQRDPSTWIGRKLSSFL